jgi:transcriptional regulator with XRE-family HTH domain
MKRTRKQIKDELGPRLGKKIAEYRKKNGMTQAMLAEKVDVDDETISRFERGTVLPSLLRLFELAQALEIGVGDLLVETSLLTPDTERIFAGMLEEISPANQKLLSEIAQLMQKR